MRESIGFYAPEADALGNTERVARGISTVGQSVDSPTIVSCAGICLPRSAHGRFPTEWLSLLMLVRPVPHVGQICLPPRPGSGPVFSYPRDATR